MAWKITLTGDEASRTIAYEVYGIDAFKNGLHRCFEYKQDADKFQRDLRRRGIPAERTIAPLSVIHNQKKMRNEMPRKNIYKVELTGDLGNKQMAKKIGMGFDIFTGQSYRYKREASKAFRALSNASVFCVLKENGKVIESFEPEDLADRKNKAQATEAKSQLRLALSAKLEEYMNEAEHQDGYGYWTEYFLKPDGTWDINAMLMDFNMALQAELEDKGFEAVPKKDEEQV